MAAGSYDQSFIMLHPLDWDEDEVTRKGNGTPLEAAGPAVLPEVGTFNPRIRIIGMPAPTDPAVEAPFDPDVPWADSHKTARMPKVDLERIKAEELAALKRKKPPLPPRKSQPLDDDDLEVIEADVSSKVTVVPIVPIMGSKISDAEERSVVALAPIEGLTDEAVTMEPETLETETEVVPVPVRVVPFVLEQEPVEEDEDDSHIRNVKTGVVTSLEWDDCEDGTQPMLAPLEEVAPGSLPENIAAVLPPPSSIPRWEDEDDMTMPRRFGDLRQRARELAADHRAKQEGKGLVEPKDTLVDDEPPSAVVDVFGAAVQMSLAKGTPVLEIPNTIEETQCGLGPKLDPQISTLQAEQDAESSKEQMQSDFPAFGIGVSEPPLKSIEISLDDLERACAEEAADDTVADEPSNDGDRQEILPTSTAPTTKPSETPEPSEIPSRMPSVMPVSLEAPKPPMKKRRAPWLTLGAAALASVLGVGALFMMPGDGELTVRLRTADGGPASKAEIFVDGQKHCDTDPCVVTLAEGSKTVKVIVPGGAPEVATVKVKAGAQETLWIDVPTADAPVAKTAPAEVVDAPAKAEQDSQQNSAALPKVTVSLDTKGARVWLKGDGLSKRLRGPWPMELTLDAGDYKLIASRHGFATYEQSFSLSRGDSAPSFDIALERAKRRRVAPTKDAPAAEPPTEPQPTAEQKAAFDPYEDD